MIVALDFDKTFTADPALWVAFCQHARYVRGHTVVMVTGRADREMLSDPTRHWGNEVRGAIAAASAVPFLDAVVFAGGRPKRLAAMHAGYKVDVWIDDDPEHVGG